ncbi:MAG TPA: CBS domain-containing protein [Anaeromyxobacteraceae bacterium]|nr:CBS domain-containing protein [Anaeromyxobacteraceae bacterium]
MGAQREASPRAGLVEVRRLSVLSGDGQAVDRRTVRCPDRGRSLALEECLGCSESGGLARPAGARVDYVACRHPRSAAPATPREDVRALLQATPVWTAMTTRVVALRPDVSLDSVAELFFDEVISGAPVVDADGRPIGVVSTADLLGKRFVEGTEAVPARDARRSGGAGPEPGMHAELQPVASVADAMTHGTVTVHESASIAKAAALMAVRGIHRLPVVADDGRVVGIVTSSDVARFVAQIGGFLPGGDA